MRSLTVGLLLLASISLAQQPAPQKPRPQNIEFGESDIDGKRATPLGDIYLPPLKKKFDSMIRVRMNFNDKLRESVHEM